MLEYLLELNKPVLIGDYTTRRNLDILNELGSIDTLKKLDVSVWRWRDNDKINYGDFNYLAQNYEEFCDRSPNANIKQSYFSKLDIDDPLFDFEQGRYWVWWASRESVTPLHKDPFNNFVLQIRGTKLWNLYSPDYNSDFYEKNDNNFEFSRDMSDLGVSPTCRFVMKPNELLFVPSNWSHEVYCINDDTLSLNCFLN